MKAGAAQGKSLRRPHAQFVGYRVDGGWIWNRVALLEVHGALAHGRTARANRRQPPIYARRNDRRIWLNRRWYHRRACCPISAALAWLSNSANQALGFAFISISTSWRKASGRPSRSSGFRRLLAFRSRSSLAVTRKGRSSACGGSGPRITERASESGVGLTVSRFRGFFKRNIRDWMDPMERFIF